MIKVGDKVTERITALSTINSYKGTVVYVHPLGQYYTVEFDFPGGSFRESYPTFKCEM